MFTFKTIALAAVALGTIAVATPAEAHDRRYRHKHVHGRVVVYSSPRVYYSRDYDRPYRYHRPYVYDRRPDVTIAFGGHRHRHHHHRR
jgi:hypothetical protein